jgi:lipopolysaccharide exporter
MLRAFLPVLAAMRSGVDEINAAVIKTASAVNTITFPIGLGFAAVAVPACSLILGPTWAGAAQYVAAFAVLSTLQIVQAPFSTLLTMRGHTKVQSKVVWLEFAVFAVAAAVLVPKLYLIGLVWARLLGAIVALVITLLAARKSCSVPLRATAKALLRPLVGAVLMYLLVVAVTSQFDSDLLKLAIGVACGATWFITWSLGTWLLVGKPEGLESTFMDYFRKFYTPKSAS